ncbi:hypothetical protein P3H15_28240 [Rhodococcus sp. T2V]|uniref:hypothetical protein n=1 Tax=Rhodococcus sp. T2V TaxID=3034164 RepID=UPI0023E3115B|nr:hypothetical protein [Rhodococcus sp. T2V]MDF3308909.1 hypothetical protein [Rhodococcus sp. T2V]
MAELTSPDAEPAVPPARPATRFPAAPESLGASIPDPPTASSEIVAPAAEYPYPESPLAPALRRDPGALHTGVTATQEIEQLTAEPHIEAGPPAQLAPPPSIDSVTPPTVGPRTRLVPTGQLPGPLRTPQSASPLARGGFHDPVGAETPEPATEVHVHIGRIELTAVSESRPSQRTVRPARSARSLDEYLQQRRDRSG